MRLTTIPAVFYSPGGKFQRSKGTNVPPSKAYIDLVPSQHSTYSSGQHTLVFYTMGVIPEGQVSHVGVKPDVELSRSVEARYHI